MQYYFDPNLANANYTNEDLEIIKKYKKVILSCYGWDRSSYKIELYYYTYLLLLLKKYDESFLEKFENELNSNKKHKNNEKEISLFELIYIKLNNIYKLTKEEKEIVEEIYNSFNEIDIKENLTIQKFNENALLIIDIYRKMNISTLKKVISEPLQLVNSDFEIPTELNELIVHLLKIEPSEKVFFNISGFGDNLDIYIENKRNITENISNQLVSLNNRIRANAIYGNDIPKILSKVKESSKNKYDKIFNNYPIGIKIDKNKIDNIISNDPFIRNLNNHPSISSDWFLINESLKRLNKNGKLIVLMPNGPLFKIADREIKKELISRGLIEEIIALPEKILLNTTIQLNIVVFSFNNSYIKMIDASKCFIETNDKTQVRKLSIGMFENIIGSFQSKEVRKITINEVDDDFNLVVNNYTYGNKIKLFNSHLLSEYIDECFRGYQKSLKNYIDPNGEYEVLNGSNLEDGMITDNLIRINPKNIKLDRYLLKENDVIISSHGVVKIGTIKKIGNRKIIATGNFTVIRLNVKKLNPLYLEAYLNSSNGKIILKKLSTGATVYSFTPGKILNLEISMIDKNKQDELIKEYENKKIEIMLTKNRLKKLQNQLNDFFDNNVEEES